MVTISSLWFMILIELLIATTVVLVLLIGLGIVRKLRDRKAAALIIQKIKEDETRRIEETKKILLHKFGFDDEAAAKIAVKISHGERSLYQDVISLYLRRDASGLENLNITFEDAVDPYRTLDLPGGGSSVKSANESKELKELKEENKRLSEEISVTMQTMGRMLSEYSAMFAEKAKEHENDAQAGKDTQEKDNSTSAAAEDAGSEPESEKETVEAEESNEEPTEDAAKDIVHAGSNMVEEMDDLSDLDPKEDKDLKEVEAPENPDDLIG